MRFPDGFLWGSATASYQVEGAVDEGGRGQSVWDMFCRRPDAVWQGQTGAVACDHYHRYRQDVGLMAAMGLKAYRFSVAWPRVMPAGTGAVNEEGLDFYDRLVDELAAHGIEPCVTLFHWDYPYELYCRGGWLHPDSPEWFAEYAGVMAQRLGDRVKWWITMNEPQCFIDLGMRQGVHAPGDRLGIAEVVRAAHHTLLGHGHAVQALRAAGGEGSRVGYAPVGTVGVPVSSGEADIEAARRWMFQVWRPDLWNNSWWMDPIGLGAYPEDGLRQLGAYLPEGWEQDMGVIGQPLDFLGVNIYSGMLIRAGMPGESEQMAPPVGVPCTAMDWDVRPESLYWGPKFLWERYRLPVVITENGAAVTEWVGLDGAVRDPARVDFLRRYLLALGQVVSEGVRVDGYFVWTLLDNFEWAHGYKRRFGLHYVDYGTLERTPKDSARWYARVIATNGESLAEDPA